MSQRGPAFTPLGAIAVLSISFATVLVAFTVAVGVGAPPLVAVVLGQLVLLAAPLIACTRTRRPLAAIGLARPRGRLLVAAVLIGASMWFINLRLSSLLPLPKGQVLELEKAVEGPQLAAALVVIALVPAVCEELLFRGLVLRGLASHYIPIGAITMTAALFSLYHLSVVQLLPTFTLGLALGVLALRGESVIPAMLAHLLNNAAAILVARRELPGAGWIDQHTGATLAIAAATTTAGVVLAARSPKPRTAA